MHIINTPAVLRHNRNLPLLEDGDNARSAADEVYPRTISFAPGVNHPLFIGGIVSESKISRICNGIAAVIARRFAGQNILLVQILEGARPFCKRVINYLRTNFPAFNCEVTALKVSSYTNGSHAGEHKISFPLADAEEKLQRLSTFDKVVILDDLLDMGNTVHWLATEYFARLSAPPLQTFFMLEKKRRRTKAVELFLEQSNAVCGCLVPNEWVVGFGLDINLPGRPGQRSLHLFRSELPGGIYAFNGNIEQKLIKKYQTTPDDLIRQLNIYASDV